MRFCEGQAVQLYIDLSVILTVLTLPTRLKSGREISSKALDFRHFLDLGSFKQVEMVLTLR